MKFLDLLKNANHNLLRSKLRSFLTILAIFVGSFTIILNSAINAGVNDFIDKQIDGIGGDGYLEIAPSVMYDQIEAMMTSGSSVTEYNPEKGSFETATISDEDLKKIRATEGVVSITPLHMASAEYITSDHTAKKYNITLAVTADNSLTSDMLTGRQVDADSSEREIMLTEDYIEPLGFESAEDVVGRTVTLGVKQAAKCYFVKSADECIATVTAKVTGVQAPGILGSSARMNLALNNALYDLSMEGVSDGVKNKTTFAVGHADPEKVDDVKEKLEKLGFTAITVSDTAGMIRTFFDIVLVVFNIFGIIALIAAAIGIINTLFMSVQERTREIGLSKALGLSNGKIFLSFSIEAILLGLWGSIFGILVSMAIGYSANSLFHQPGQFLETFPTFDLVKFSPDNVLPIVAMIMFVAFLAGTAPARQASKKDPIEALRYE